MAYSLSFKQACFVLLDQGYSISEVARIKSVPRKTLSLWVNAKKGENAKQYREARIERSLPAPLRRGELSPEARRALDDFAYFRYRYFGRRSTPWQEEAAYSVVEWLKSPETELIVMNTAPGAGKSTLFTCDIPAWMICRDRTIRVFLGHRVASEASTYASRIRQALARTRPLPANPAQGREIDAEACLAVDFGRFKPDAGDIWRQSEFTVLSDFGDQESAIEDKEPTVVSHGMESGFLGTRANLVVWDDLIDNKVLRNPAAVEHQQKWWDEEGVTRVEPGGCLILVGQRMGANDLYRYCLDEKMGDEEDEDGNIIPNEESRYRHIIYPAHFEDRCTGKHTKTLESAYPQGCLLDPIRIPWTGKNGLTTIRKNRVDKYRVLYQQEDVDPANQLVPLIYVNGGRDPQTGIEYPGCWDEHRGLCEFPRGLATPWYSIATVDPSPTKFWAIEWWIYHPASEQRFLMDLVKQSMSAGEFLDWNENMKVHYGLAEDWQKRSHDLGAPITHWIIEQNAAQRFLLSLNSFKMWQRKWAVNVLAHNTTGTNKLDPEYGIQMLRDRYMFGNVRLPGRRGVHGDGGARLASLKLVEEATKYPEWATDDCLMAQWFLEYHLPTIAKPRPAHQPRQWRPSFMRQPA